MGLEGRVDGERPWRRDRIEGGQSRPRLRAVLRRHGLWRRPSRLRRFLRTHELRFTEGNRVEVFEHGKGGLNAMLGAIRGARSRVHFETYILRSDATGRTFFAALAERARQGVAVRLLYDAFGSLTLDDAALDDLRAAGADVVAFNPLRRLYPRWFPRRRDHRKLLVVDGRVAFVGGLNIGDEYNAGAEDGPAAWRDTHFRIEGPAVRDLEAVFLESWFRADGPDLPWGNLLDAQPGACGQVRCAVVPDGPVYRRRVTRDLLVVGLRSARQDICLTSPYFAPDRRVYRALVRAGAKGVRVGLLLAGKSDHPALRRAAHALLPRLLEAGVQVWEHEGSMLHAKTAVFDDRWAVVGTSNLDRQSFEHSYEVNLVIEGGEIPQRLRMLFDRDLTQAKRIDAATLAQRNWIDRILDGISALLLRVI
jgi:cardiolipin synthase A/B